MMATWAQIVAKNVNNKDLKRETLSRNTLQNREELRNNQVLHTSNKSERNISDTKNRSELVLVNWSQESPQENNSDDNKDDFDEPSFYHYLDKLILKDQKRLLIDHYRIYLTTLDEFKPIFEQVKTTDSIFTMLNWRNWKDFLEKLPTEFWNNNKKILTVAVYYSDLPREIQVLKKDDLAEFLLEMSNSSLGKEPDKEEWLLMAKIVSQNMPVIEARIFELVNAGLI